MVYKDYPILGIGSIYPSPRGIWKAPNDAWGSSKPKKLGKGLPFSYY